MRFKAPLVLVALVLLMLSVPAVQAQGQRPTELSMEIEGVEGTGGTAEFVQPIPPGETRSFTVWLNYSWPEGGYAMSPTEIELDIDQTPAWAEVEWNRTLILAEVPESEWGTGGETTVTALLNVTVTEEAPAFDPEAVFLTGRAKDNNERPRGNLEASSARGQTTPLLAAGILAQVRVTPAEGLVQIRGGETRQIPVDVQNTGNTAVRAQLGATDVPESIDVQIPANVRVTNENTTTVNMTITANDIFSSLESSFQLQAVPFAERNDDRGPRTTFDVVVSVRDLPSAVLLGQQTLTEVFIFTAVFVGASFVVGWPLTVWWEDRRKSKRGRDRGQEPDSPADRKVYGIPAEGRDYVVVQDSDIFERARSVRPRDHRVYGVPEQGDDYVVVDDDEVFDRDRAS